MIDYRVYLVTDDPSRYGAGDAWLDNVVAAVEGGVTCVQYRDTESDDATRYARVRRLQNVLRARSVPLIVNNEAELAATVKAEGIHVGQSDMPPERVRQVVGPACEIGLSITAPEQVAPMLALRRKGFVDAIGIGPVYDATKTKADAAHEMGLGGLAEIVRLSEGTPNCAIGGITLERAPGIVAAGAQGLAVVSAFSKAPDPASVAHLFRILFR